MNAGRLLAWLAGPMNCSGPRAVTVLYATHVFEGIDAWATHLLHLRRPTHHNDNDAAEGRG